MSAAPASKSQEQDGGQLSLQQDTGEDRAAPSYGVLASRIPPGQAIQLVTKDLALHAAIRYYETVLRIKGSFPPGVDTIIRGAEAFEDYYADYGVEAGES